MATPIFKIDKVSKVYSDHIVLDDINLEINAGEIFGIIGASGSGKTTLLNIIIGFVRPEVGDVLFRTEHLLDYKEAHTFSSVFKKYFEVKKAIGVAAQTPSFYTTLTVRENLEYFGSLYNLNKEALRSNIITLLNLMDLRDALNVQAKNLSGGMQRRLDMACSLIHDPKILVLDEPTADLDPLLRNHIWRLVKKINKRGTTVILASHHLTELETLCTRIAILKDGKILEVGTPNEIKNRFAKTEEIHLESFPGNYDVITNIKNKDILKEIQHIQNKGTKVVVYTSKPEKVLKELLQRIEENNETIIDLKVNKPTLDEIFILISQSEKDKEEEVEEDKSMEDEKKAKDKDKDKEKEK